MVAGHSHHISINEQQQQSQPQEQEQEQQQQQASTSSGDNEEDTFNIVVMDSWNFPSPPNKIEMTMSKNATGAEFFNKFVENTEHSKEYLELKFQNKMIELDDERLLYEVCGMPAKKVIMTASKKKGAPESVRINMPNMIKERDHDVTSTSQHYNASSSNYGASSQYPSSSSSSSSSQQLVTYGPAPATTHTYPSTSQYTSSYSYYSNPAGKSSTGYIGLSNQGATCYMNSLIQSLFMTPEFRNALYNWSFDEKVHNDFLKSQNGKEGENGKNKTENADGKSAQNEKKPENGNGATQDGENGHSVMHGLNKEEREKKERLSIPLQLQRLFARLQLCDVQAVKTKDLTKSFGWEDADAFTQHDVQELCRVLFDALEKNFQGTKQANLVNDLYQGKMKDYVKCKECKHESARVDHYLDIPLVIRGFGETVPVKSVEEALQKFVTPEVLEKDNQYNCEKCAKKVDAIKGLKIEKFPYLLTLQLKRFDFDFTTMRRIKLNDRVTFPLYLDLNPFIHGKRAPTQKKQKQEGSNDVEEGDEEVEAQEADLKGKGRAEDQKADSMSIDADDSAPEPQSVDFIDHEPDFEAPPPLVTPELPYVYELFSVMIHRGSSMGGHYYAYVKSFETNKWYEFNDSMVSEITVNEVKKAFGGDEEGGYGGMSRMYSSYRSNSNAYMLMYRQIEANRNSKPMSATDIPETLRKVVEEENGAAKNKKKEEELEREMIKLTITYDGENKPLSVHKSSTFNETTKSAANLFGITERYTAGNYRLRGYTAYSELPGETYTGREHKSLNELNFYPSFYSPKTLLLETKEPHETFDDYDTSQMLCRVAKYNPETQDFGPVMNVYVSKNGTVKDLREAVAVKTGIPANKQNLYKEPTYASSWNSPPATLFDKPLATDLAKIHMIEPEKFYVEYTERPLGYEDSDDEEEAEDGKYERKQYSGNLDSPVIASLERQKNMIEVKYNLPGKEEADQKIVVDKNITLKEFREKIQPVIGLPIDEFKIKRGSTPHLYELVNDTESLADVSVRDGSTLTIEKGKPLKEGEAIYTFEYFDLSKDTDNFTDLFEIPVHEDMLVLDLKKMIMPMLQEKKIAVTDPTHIRLRDVSTSQNSRRLNKVFQDSVTVKKATSYVYLKRFAVTILNEPECVQNQELCFFVQQFKPSTFEITRKEDFVISEDATIDELRERLGEKYGIAARNVGVLRVDYFYHFYDDPDLLEVPDMNWDRPTVSYSTKNTVGETMMMRNGYLIICRDNTEKLKELTKEEKEAIKKETNKRKNSQNQNSSSSSYSFFNRKERALKINSEG